MHIGEIKPNMYKSKHKVNTKLHIFPNDKKLFMYLKKRLTDLKTGQVKIKGKVKELDQRPFNENKVINKLVS